MVQKEQPEKTTVCQNQIQYPKLEECIRKEEQKKIKYSTNLKIFNLGILASENWKLNYRITELRVV